METKAKFVKGPMDLLKYASSCRLSSTSSSRNLVPRHDGDGGGVRDGDVRLRLTGTCTFHNSSALDLAVFQFLVLVKQKIAGDEDPFLVNRS